MNDDGKWIRTPIPEKLQEESKGYKLVSPGNKMRQPSMPIEWLTIVHIDDWICYSLDEAREKYEVRDLGADVYLVLNWDEEKIWLKFALFTFHSSEMNDENTLLSVQFFGEGPANILRECRHTYWGDDGYLFYPNGSAIAAGFKALSEFFDGLV